MNELPDWAQEYIRELECELKRAHDRNDWAQEYIYWMEKQIKSLGICLGDTEE